MSQIHKKSLKDLDGLAVTLTNSINPLRPEQTQAKVNVITHHAGSPHEHCEATLVREGFAPHPLSDADVARLLSQLGEDELLHLEKDILVVPIPQTNG